MARALQDQQYIVPDRQRIIVALGNHQEATIVAGWLEADGFDVAIRTTAAAAVEEMHRRPYDLLITDSGEYGRQPLRAIGQARRPMTPTILLGDAPPPRNDVVTGPTLYVARPIDRVRLDCYVSMAMLEGGPVRRSPRKAVTPFEAVVNGIPSQIIDVSVDGVRIEVMPDRRIAVPPMFTLRVPLVGVGVAMQRVWARTSSAGASGKVAVGASLAPNAAAAVQGWRALVDSIPAAVRKA